MLGKIEAHYDYAAFGAVIAQKGDCAEANPQFSSDVAVDAIAWVW